MYFEQLKTKLFADVPYPPEMCALMTQVGTWRQFCQLRSEIKELFTFPDHQSLWQDPGYKRRRPDPIKKRDNKENFHFHSNYRALLRHYHLEKIVEENPTLKTLYQFIDQLHPAVMNLIEVIGNDLAKHVPGLPAELAKGRDLVVIRFCHYTPEPNDQILAAAHADRSGFTLHLYESRPGLQLFDLSGKWIEAPLNNKNTIVFTGYQFELATAGKLQRTWHRVIQQQPNTIENRISVVVFVPFVDTATFPEQASAHDVTPAYIREFQSRGQI